MLEHNIKGTYNLFAAAAKQHCRRVIFASSIQTLEGYPRDTQVHPEMPVRPTNMYGVSKCFGEAVASYFATTQDLSCIVVRIGQYSEEEPSPAWSAHGLSRYLSVRDCQHLLRRCIEVEGIRYAVVHGVSANRFGRFNLEATRELLGYAPQDDGFASVLLQESEVLPEWGRSQGC